MSSSWVDPTPVAAHCIDGVTTESCTVSGNGCHPYLCHTGDAGLEWLVVTVTGYDVDKVVVYNRVDDGHDRIQRAKLIYSNDFEGSSVLYQSSFGNTTALTYTFDLTSNSPPVLTEPRTDYRNHYQLLYNSGTNSFEGNCRGPGWNTNNLFAGTTLSMEDCAVRCDYTAGCTGLNYSPLAGCWLFYHTNIVAEESNPGNKCWKRISSSSQQLSSGISIHHYHHYHHYHTLLPSLPSLLKELTALDWHAPLL